MINISNFKVGDKFFDDNGKSSDVIAVICDFMIVYSYNGIFYLIDANSTNFEKAKTTSNEKVKKQLISVNAIFDN